MKTLTSTVVEAILGSTDTDVTADEFLVDKPSVDGVLDILDDVDEPVASRAGVAFQVYAAAINQAVLARYPGIDNATRVRLALDSLKADAERSCVAIHGFYTRFNASQRQDIDDIMKHDASFKL